MRVFISYRRPDTLNVSGRLKAELEAVPGIDEVFFDFDSIEYGADFEGRIQSALDCSSHCLVMIGHHWVGDDGDGRRRIDQATDFVRLEAARALTSKAKVLPVLVDGATMPGPDRLPEDVASIARINAVALRSTHFRHDLEPILDALFGRTKVGRRAPLSTAQTLLRASLGAVSAAATMIVLGVVSSVSFPDCPSLACRVQGALGLESQEAALGPLGVLVAATLVAGAVIPMLLPRPGR